MAENEKNNVQSSFEQRKNARILRAATPGAVVLNPSSELTRELVSNIRNFDTATSRLSSEFFTNPDKAKYEKAQKIIASVMDCLTKGAKEISALAQTRYIPTPSERRQEREESVNGDQK